MSTCLYCEKGETMNKVGLEIAKLSVSTLYLFREQSHPGRCVVAYSEHIGDITELDDAKRNAFFADVVTASRAIQALHHPDKVNYGAYSDSLRHLHMHLVPKHKEGFEWGGVFAMNPQAVYLSDGEYDAMVRQFQDWLR